MTVTLPYKFDDGGRKAAGLEASMDDCVCRAIAIAGRLPYLDVYAALAEGYASVGDRTYLYRNGINVQLEWFYAYMQGQGFEWVSTLEPGSDCRVLLRKGELSERGRLVVQLSHHTTALIHGVIHDNHDPSRDGTRCVYGYWQLKE